MRFAFSNLSQGVHGFARINNQGKKVYALKDSTFADPGAGFRLINPRFVLGRVLRPDRRRETIRENCLR
jgi:hypothetical protein